MDVNERIRRIMLFEERFGGFPFERTESNSEQNLEHSFLSLFRIRDFVSQLLSYPMGTAEAGALKQWISDVLEFNSIKESYTFRTDTFRIVKGLLAEKPLRCMRGLIPEDIISQVEDGKMFIFNENTTPVAQELIASASTGSKQKQVLQSTDAGDLTTQDVLDFAADLAVGQLFQVLRSVNHHAGNIHHVRFSARNGVEKRAVMKKIEESLKGRDIKMKINQTFMKVLRIDASKYDKDAEVQVSQQIAEELTTGESIEEEMTKNKYLVLLVDGDGKGKLNLQRVDVSKSKLEGVLVLITTKSESLAEENEELMRAIDLEIRTEDHLLPWELFLRNVGSELMSSSNAIQSTALRIVRECHCHILCIGLVAKWLKNVQDVELWQFALDKLRHNDEIDEDYSTGMTKVIDRAFLNIIWEGLSPTEKKCLKLWLSVPTIKDGEEDYLSISEWIRAGLACTREEAEQVLRQLSDRHILLELERSKDIRLPEEIYDIIESLLTPTDRESGLVMACKSGQWYADYEIDLSKSNLSELPPSPICPKLERLCLQGNPDLTEIPPSFFSYMPILEEVNLSHTSVRDLPCSFWELTKLKKIYLACCELFPELPLKIGQLGNLETIDLQGTQITHLPEVIRELTKLTELKLSFDKDHGQIGRGKGSAENSSSIMIPIRVISNLTVLETLTIEVEPDDERWHQNLHLILPKILGLWRLRYLSLHIPQVELLKLIVASSPIRFWFRFVVGRHMQRIISRVPPAVEADFAVQWNALRFINGVDIPMEIKEILRLVTYLFLDRHMTIKNLHEFELDNLKELRNCVLAECNEMQTIFDGRQPSHYSVKHLESLRVFCMKNLRSIWEVPAHPYYFFYQLRHLELHTCPKLSTIFTLDFVGNLSRLEVLTVEDCPQVSAIISHQSSGSKDRVLPSLKKVSLLYLPELVSISNGLHFAEKLESIGFYYCPKLDRLSSKELSSEKLKGIKGEKQWWEALIWGADDWGQSSPPHNLNHLFSPIDEAIDI